MHTAEQKIQERLGAALQRLSTIEQRASTGESRSVQMLLKEFRHLVSELEHGFSRLQEAGTQHAELRRQVEAASKRAGILFELSPLPCVVVHETGLILEANTAGTRLLNTSGRHLHGKSFELFLAGDRAAFLAWLKVVAHAPECERRTVTIRPREQRARSLTLVATAEADGQVAFVFTDEAAAPAFDESCTSEQNSIHG